MPRETSRRHAMARCAGALAGWSWSGIASADPGRGQAPMGEPNARRPTSRPDEALDDALSLLHRREPESLQGLSTHAPMVAEALCSLGHAEKAVAWVADYRAPILRLPVPTQAIDRDHWRSALGARPGAASWEEALARWADWREFFSAELEKASWMSVLDTWSARLAPGLCGAATHGVIRTAHAARALSRRETKTRRAELARGLAYWAAAYQELGGHKGGPPPAPDFESALLRLPLYFEKHGGIPAGNIVAGLRAASELPGFGEAMDAVALPGDVSKALSSLTATSARLYLQHGTSGRGVGTIAFVHAVTGPAALRKIAPLVRPETARAALPYAWQAAAAIYVAYAHKDNPRREPKPSLGPGELSERALANGDEHAIKFTEALLAEHAIAPDPAYLAAAADAVERL